MSDTILVTGGTGLLGSRLIPFLQQHEITYRIGSRSRPADDRHWVRLDITNGEGLPAAMEGVSTVFHLASGTKGFSAETDIGGTEKLLEQAVEQQTRHFIYISIVGIDRTPYRYYRYKLEAERLIQASGVPYTILRATQFHDFMDMILRLLLRFPIGPVPKDFLFQPVATEVAAEHLYNVYQQGAHNAIVELGGPEVLPLGQMARTWAKARSKRKWVFHLPIPGAMPRAIRGGSLTCPDQAVPGQSWQEWVQQRYAAKKI